jgi:hypothetical protein
MNQYTERKVPMLLKNTKTESGNFKILNGMVEFTMDGERVVVPTAEAFQRLVKKVAVLEQRLASTDNKASRAARSTRD